MDKLEILWVREQIRDLLHTYCHGIDRRDWDLVRSCFGDDHEHSHGSFTGNADEFIHFSRDFLDEVSVSHHSVVNTKIEIAEDGTSAHCDANFIAFHMIEDGKVQRMSFPSNGKGTDWVVAGRYIDELKLRDGRWVIVKREALNRWMQSTPI